MSRLQKALRAFHRALRFRSRREAPAFGIPSVLDGFSALASLEASIAEVCSSADLQNFVREWREELEREDRNLFDTPLSLLRSESLRGAFAASMGLALAGRRVSATLSSADLHAVQDQLCLASSQHLPLVTYVCLAASDSQDAAVSPGQQALHASAQSGWLQLVAGNVQELVDLAVVARRLAETALLPVMVAMDGRQTGEAIQDLHLPPPEFLRTFLAAPDDEIPCPDSWQEMLFGARRRRLPRWYDLDRPSLIAARQGDGIRGLAIAGQRPFFAERAAAIYDELSSEYSAAVGRPLDAFSEYRLEDAELVLLVMGAGIECAQALADDLRARNRKKVGVIGIRRLQPFPGKEIIEKLRGKRDLLVLERCDQPLAEDPPLLSMLRSAASRMLDDDRAGSDAKWTPWALPQFRAAIYGLAGLPLRATDLAAACCRDPQSAPELVYLGLELAGTDSRFPKRRVLLETMARNHPEIAKLGLCGEQDGPRLGAGSRLAIIRARGSKPDLAEDAARLVQSQLESGLRSRIGLRLGEIALLDWLQFGDDDPRDPGDEIQADIIIAADPRLLEQPAARSLFAQGASLLLLPAPEALSSELSACIDGQGLELSSLSAGEAEGRAAQEMLLGALITLLNRRGAEISGRRASSTRLEQLDHLDEDERELLGNAFQMGMESLEALDLPSSPAGTREHSVPAALRELRWPEESYDNLGRFWDQVGILHAEGREAELSPDPYLSSQTLPPLSASLRDLSCERDSLPAFDPSACTACGSCWTACPDSAIAALAISWPALLEAGMQKATRSGRSADALRPLLGKLADRAQKIFAGESPAPAAAEILQPAFDWLMEKMSPAEERRQKLQLAFAALVSELGDMPLVRSAVCFDEPEAINPGSGEVFSLAINPRTCKACMACVEECPEDALSSELQTQARIDAAAGLWRLWEEMPDTAGASIERLSRHPLVGRAAAILLSRHCLLSMSGGDLAEAGSGEKVALHLTLAACEYHLQPLLQRRLEQVDELIAKSEEEIRSVLARALPDDDLEKLSQRLEDSPDRHVELSDVISDAALDKRIDRGRLQRLVDLAQRLRAFASRLRAGVSGLGRARAGLVLSPGGLSDRLAAHPFNPFACPVVFDASGESAQLAQGLMLGQIGGLLDDIHLLRQCQRELERPAEAASSAGHLPKLHWEDLSAEERELCPPIILVGDEGMLGSRGLSQLTSVLGGGYPILVLCLSSLDAGLQLSAGASPGAGKDLALLATLQRDAFVLQSSIAQPDHLVAGVLDALRCGGPALAQVHAPSPSRDGFPEQLSMSRARSALSCRAQALFRYDPRSEGVFGLRFDLTGNPEPDEVDGELRPRTFADWAVAEERFALCFPPLAEDAESPTALADYMSLAGDKRREKTPFIVLPGEEGETEQRLAVSAEMVAACEDRLASWQVLQELAGEITPFTDRLREDLAGEISQEHQAELQAQKQLYEGKLESLRGELQVEFTARIKNRLMALAAQHARSDANGGRGQ